MFIGYDLMRSGVAHNFGIATCSQAGGGTTATDPEVPVSGRVFHYLVRAGNLCGANLGYDSAGRPRQGECPP